MTAALKGLLHGNTITLETTVPIEEKIELSAQEQAELWREWAERGPQGPIPDEDAEPLIQHSAPDLGLGDS